ncbi:MAG: G5 domain-containing protein [Bifidobacteriaceae bacterium]|jgi:hypothetical protein|nr:G5 domain-containing protein [Bifidobacteriaceae bacterium]
MARRVAKRSKLKNRLFEANKIDKLQKELSKKGISEIHGIPLAIKSVLGLRKIAKAFVCIFLCLTVIGLFSASWSSRVSEALSANNQNQGNISNEKIANTSIHLIHLYLDGATSDFYSSAEKVSDVIYQKNIVVNFNYGVYPDPSTPIDKETQIFVGPITTSIETSEKIVKYKTQEVKDNTFPKGYRQKTQDGKDGKSNITFIARYIGPQPISKTSFAESIEIPVQNEIYTVGTLDLPTGGDFSADDAKGFAKSALSSFGWPISEFVCLDQLWDRESHWNVHAANGASGAYGIPQALPGDKMASAGPDWQNNAQTQIKWGMHYIQDRYSTPCGAWSHSQLFGWY